MIASSILFVPEKRRLVKNNLNCLSGLVRKSPHRTNSREQLALIIRHARRELASTSWRSVREERDRKQKSIAGLEHCQKRRTT
jgi:hypothetical protein